MPITQENLREEYKQRNGAISQTAPMDFLDDDERQVVFDATGKLRVSLYKALLFIKVADAIKSGSLNLKHSYKYRSLDNPHCQGRLGNEPGIISAASRPG